VNFLADAGAFVLLALGLNIVIGFAGLLDLGYAAFFAIGSYTFAMLASPQFGIHIPFWVMLFVASGVAALFGILLGAPTLRLRGDYLAIVTLGFGEIVPQTFLNLSQWTGGPNGIGSLDQPSVFGYRFGFAALPYYYLILLLIAVAVLAANNLRNSRLGRAWMAIREDELAAAHVGINTTATKLAAFAIGASFSGLAGCAYASKLQLVSPDQFGFNVSVAVLSMLVLGGMGNIPGVIVGSLVISSLDRFILPQLTNFMHGFGVQIDLTNSRFLIYGIILVMTMLFRPEGLIPSRQRRSELRAGDGIALQEQELFTEATP
jgi:branched-chain amino acid transport system permease protein